MNDIDFARSFVRFTSTRVNHTPRLQLDACCTISAASGDASPRTYCLSVPCIGEAMYVDRDLIHQPPQEFALVVLPGRQFLMMKRCPSVADDVRGAFHVGQAMPTHSGTPSVTTEADATIRRFPRVEPITNYQQFRQAVLDDLPINGRTTYVEGDMQIVLDYPGHTVNVAHGREAWQVDAGPVLIASEPQADDMEITRMNLAYLVFNAWDWADVAVRRPTPLSDHPEAKTLHFSGLRRLTCRNELFCYRQ